MKVTSLQLKKYKRFFHLQIEFGPRPKRIVALVGPNGCGKSSVFDAMLFLNNSYDVIGECSMKNYKYHSLCNDPGYNRENIVIRFDEGDYRGVRQVNQYPHQR